MHDIFIFIPIRRNLGSSLSSLFIIIIIVSLLLWLNTLAFRI